MRGLIYSAYYEPEIAASLYLSTNLYEDLAKSGVMVSLYVPTPTRGVTEDERRIYSTSKKIEKKCEGNLVIKRVSLPREGKNTIKRVLRYLLLNLAFITKSFREKTDFIFVQSTPPTQGAMAALIKKIKKVPLIYNLQDIFPDSLVGTGITTDGSLIFRIGKLVEKFTYKNCDKIIVISEDMKNNIVRKGVPEDKITVIRNWVDIESIHPINKTENYLYEKFKVNRNNFNVVYAGNLGYAQNIEVILQAAKKLQTYPDIQFFIFGKGNQEEQYKKAAEELQLSNLRFFPLQPYSEVSYVYSLADVSIVSCKKGFGESAMPSKVWSILATGTPIVASFDKGTELEFLINKNNLGLFGDADDADVMAQNILQLYNNRDDMTQLSDNALNYVINTSSRQTATKKYIDVIKAIVLK